MNEFTPKLYGVKRINNYFAVEATSYESQNTLIYGYYTSF